MTLRENANDWTIKEQIIDDPVCGLAFQFERGPDGLMRFRIYGHQFNRDFIFDKNGHEAGSGMLVSGLCKPSWPDPSVSDIIQATTPKDTPDA